MKMEKIPKIYGKIDYERVYEICEHWMAASVIFFGFFELKTKTEQWNSKKSKKKKSVALRMRLCHKCFPKWQLNAVKWEFSMKYDCDPWGRKQLEVLTIEIGNPSRIWLMREHILIQCVHWTKGSDRKKEQKTRSKEL